MYCPVIYHLIFMKIFLSFLNYFVWSHLGKRINWPYVTGMFGRGTSRILGLPGRKFACDIRTNISESCLSNWWPITDPLFILSFDFALFLNYCNIWLFLIKDIVQPSLIWSCNDSDEGMNSHNVSNVSVFWFYEMHAVFFIISTFS